MNQEELQVDIKRLADFATKPVLAETPFSVSQIVEPLQRSGFRVIPVFIIETEDITRSRYEARERKPIIRIACYR